MIFVTNNLDMKTFFMSGCTRGLRVKVWSEPVHFSDDLVRLKSAQQLSRECAMGHETADRYQFAHKSKLELTGLASKVWIQSESVVECVVDKAEPHLDLFHDAQ